MVSNFWKMGEKKSSHILLRVVLVVIGIFFAMNGAGVFLPLPHLQRLTGLFAGSEQIMAMWPENELFDYLLRASCVAYLWIGITFFIATRDPVRYRALIDVGIGGLFLFGVVCLGVGMKDNIPVRWCLGDSFLAFLGGILLVLLRPRTRARLI